MLRELREEFNVISTIDEEGINSTLLNEFPEVAGSQVIDFAYVPTLIVYSNVKVDESLQLRILAKVLVETGYAEGGRYKRLLDANGVQLFKLISEAGIAESVDIDVAIVHI